jgi:hypothetical protein
MDFPLSILVSGSSGSIHKLRQEASVTGWFAMQLLSKHQFNFNTPQ